MLLQPPQLPFCYFEHENVFLIVSVSVRWSPLIGSESLVDSTQLDCVCFFLHSADLGLLVGGFNHLHLVTEKQAPLAFRLPVRARVRGSWDSFLPFISLESSLMTTLVLQWRLLGREHVQSGVWRAAPPARHRSPGRSSRALDAAAPPSPSGGTARGLHFSAHPHKALCRCLGKRRTGI